MYKYLLFDADNTLLDFDRAERQALLETLSLSVLKFTDEVHERYHIINDNEWKKLERGETTKERLRTERFSKLFDEFGFDGNLYSKEIADIYTTNLSRQGQLMDSAEKVLDCFSKKYSCYIVTNGIAEIQKSRIAATTLGKYIKHSFVSQELGCEKPSLAFFEKVFSHIGDDDRSGYLVIGDSLTSDIAGAINAGIDSVLISKEHSALPTYCIKNLEELYSILD